MVRRLLQLQVVVLAIGTVFAFYTVATDVARFYDYEGTIFKVQDCVVPNPVTTPCFYGAFAFLAALTWSWFIYQKGEAALQPGQKRLTLLLAGSTLFAWGNFSRVAYDFYNAGTGATKGCSGVLTTNPFTTPCFTGSAIFLAALMLALTISYHNRAYRPV